MSQIQITNLTFSYPGSYDNIFENVSFGLDTSWKLGFIGRNGRGKTTFLKLLAGEYEYEGRISADVDFEYFPYEVADEALTPLEIAEQLSPNLMQWELIRELSLLQVGEDALCRPFFTLSNGERTKVLLAILFLKENSFLLIDEPTNHLDEAAREAVCRYLNGKSGFILVSHDRNFLDNCIDHILSVNRANIDIQKGNFSSWYQNKQQEDAFEQAESQKLRKDIQRLQTAAERTSSWSDKAEQTKYGSKNSGLRPDRGFIGHKAAKMMKRSKSISERRETAVEEKSKLLKNIETAEALKLSPLTYRKNVLLQLDKVSVQYDGNTICKPVSFTAEQGERIALCGKNGCGKSSILKLIYGESIAHDGVFTMGSGLKISYVPQDASFLKGSLSGYAEQCGIDESLFRAILRKLDFSRIQFEKDMSDFSGGQKKKVLIARSLCEQAHLYLWDEPLNFIDVFSRIQIEELLLKFKPTLIFVEHDGIFTQKIAAKIVNF